MTPDSKSGAPRGPSDRVVPVSLGDRSYDIVIGAGLLSIAGALMTPHLPIPKVFIVTDETVAALHLSTLTESLSEAGVAHTVITVAPGESTKSFATLETVLDALLEGGLERKSTVVALGGGVVGDLAGFAAAIAQRGVRFIQIPTTLLSQVDSSVGGKTAVNAKAGKNLIGAFHQPSLVLADTDVLDSLPRRELLAGYAEVVKYGALGDASFFEWLERNGPALLDGDASLRAEAVARSCEAKARIVARDERESGVRALLNLGHTFGHALESRCEYDGRLLHGEGVAIGMAMAFDLSVRLGLCAGQDGERLKAHLRAVGLPVSPSDIPDTDFSAEDLIRRMGSDKKVSAGKLTFILAKGLGRAFITQDVDPENLRASVSAALAA
ncbi:MAG: 3-dehydroquinate synthase [Alphaproteobacteria bacterium]|nr:3-dehydroquinate synthase [Alphaproteobacteria bacterium]